MKIISLLLAICLVGCGGGSPVTTSQTAQIAQTVIPPVAAAPTPVVFMGDSITDRWNSLDTHLPYVTGYYNEAISGETTAQMLARFDTDVMAKQPGTVVILGGINDILSTTNPTVDNVAAMAEKASAGGSRVVIGLLLPCSAFHAPYLLTDPAAGNQAVVRFNSQLIALANAYGYTIANYHDAMTLPDGSQNAALFVADQLHPDDAGYVVMWSILAPILTKLGVPYT